MKFSTMSTKCTLLFLSVILSISNNATAIRQQATGSLSSLNPEPPTWPSSYSVSYIFSLPYTSKIQPNPVEYAVDVHIVGQGKHPKVRVDTLNGTNTYIIHHHHEYQIMPRLDKKVCNVYKSGQSGEDVHSLAGLPDINGWTYIGITNLPDGGEVDAHAWQYETQHQAKIVQYTFWLSIDGSPLKLKMHGTELFTGAHFDEWMITYTAYTPTTPPSSYFTTPETCNTDYATQHLQNDHHHSPVRLRMTHLLPRITYAGDAAYDEFLSVHGTRRLHASLSEYSKRKRIFHQNMQKIETHNASPNTSYTLAMNHFGDWSRDEFEAVMLPRRNRHTSMRRRSRQSIITNTTSGDVNTMNSDVNSSKRNEKERDEKERDEKERDEKERDEKERAKQFELPYQQLVQHIETLPSSLDWRGSGADSGVKDQALCGSCWSFGAAGALESAWFMSTGESVSFSEQQIMDCSWGYLPQREDAASACNGGDAYVGISHISESGGIALTKDYEYLGQGNFCKEYPTRYKFKGFARVPSLDDRALMEAVYSRGPLAVSMDASQASFTFYSSGIYYDPGCLWKSEDLDHSMVLMGYGTSDDGIDYWIVKNSWSTNWGDEGTFKVARENHGCGAATDAVYAVADV